MESIWKIQTPEKVHAGYGAIAGLKNVLKKDCKRVFLVIDKGLGETEFQKSVEDQLEDVEFLKWSEFSSDPDENSVVEGAKAYSCFAPNCLIAVGGGSAADVAKTIGLMGENKIGLEQCYELETRRERYPHFICVPTTCGTGAESSPYALISNNEIPKKRCIERSFFIPNAVILDPDALSTLPQHMKAATFMDTLSHSIELHTASTSSHLTRIQTRGSLASLGRYVKNAVFDADKEALEVLLYTSFTARLLYPRTGLSIAHALAHPLGAYCKLHHGMCISILMPETIKFNEPACSGAFVEISELLGLKEKGAIGVFNWANDIVKESGIVDRVKKHLDNKIVPAEKIANAAMESSNLKSNPRNVESCCQLEEILKRALKL